MTTPSPPLRRSAALLFALALGAVPFAASASAQSSDPGPPPTVHESHDDDLVDVAAFMATVVERYATDAYELRRFYDIDISPTRLDRLDRHDEEWARTLGTLGESTDWWDPDAAIDHVLLRHHIEHATKQRATLRGRLAEHAALLPFAETIIGLEEARWALEPVDAREAAATLHELAEAVEALAERVQAAPEDDEEADDEGDADAEPPILVDAVTARRTAGHVDELARALSTWHDHHAAYVPGFTWWTQEPFDAAREQLDAYAKQLRETIAGQEGEDDDPLVGDPIGRDALVDDIAHEMLPYTPEELLALGERHFAWCEARMLEASHALGFGDDWKAALAHVKSGHVDPGGQDDLVVAQAREAVEWIDALDLVTVPELCRETWRLRMISKQGQRTLPFAAYGGQEMLVAYPTHDMDHPSKEMAMRGNNEHFSRIVTPHELIPGHHLQRFAANRHNTHRSLFGTPFYGEGWALYWELLMWEKAWHRSPEDRIGMLFWRMHRAARIVVSLSFHLESMSPEEMIDFLVDRVGHERDGATSEVRRYIAGDYSPLYQCGYLVGGLQLWALRGELVDTGAMTDRQFHDAVLECNSMPIEMVRASLKGEAPALDHRASWRFMDSIGPFSSFDGHDHDHDHGGREERLPAFLPPDEPVREVKAILKPKPRPEGAPPGTYVAHVPFGGRGRAHVVRFDGERAVADGLLLVGEGGGDHDHDHDHGDDPDEGDPLAVTTLDGETHLAASAGSIVLLQADTAVVRALVRASRPEVVAIAPSADSRYAFVACQDADGADAAVDVLDVAAGRRVASVPLQGPLTGATFYRWEKPRP